MFELVTTWDEIIQNMHEFQRIRNIRGTLVQERLHQFKHWYYFPTEDTFVPSKFLGYKNMTIERYSKEVFSGSGADGSRTEERLAGLGFFHKLTRESEQFDELFKKLEVFIKSIDANKYIYPGINKGTRGGIHVPNE